VESRLGVVEKGQQVLGVKVSGIETKVGTLETSVDKLAKEQKKQGKQLTSIKKTLDIAIDHFDKGDIKLQKRISKIEDNLGLSPL
jgi:hypothetical protein